jgi:XTP/dITP diphosphohydrolase
MRVVLATGNPGKLAEMRALLADLGLDLEPQSAFGIEPPPETGATFLDNALLKARYAASHTGLPAIADDSGLEVDALGGAPGVHSARYAGEPADDARNLAKLVGALAGVPPAARRARYRCVLVFLRTADDPEPLVASASWEGRLVQAPRGQGGFGYDPLFEIPELGLTAAELDPATKNSLSHRGTAMRSLRARLAAERSGR